MKRILVAAILAVMLVCMFVPVNAAATEILKGTPTVDGKLDDIYKQSVSMQVTGPAFYAAAGVDKSATDAVGTTYLLYDDKYLYICTVVTEKTVMAATDAYLKSVTDGNPWMQDAVENWILIDSTKTKLSLDAYGKTLYGTPAVTGKEGYIGKAVAGTGTYTVEIAFPITKKAGDSIGYALQVNDLIDAAGQKITAIGTQTPDKNMFKLSATAVTTTAAATAAPAASTAKAATTTTKAAQTADISVIYALLAASVSAGAVLTIKKKK